MHYSDIAEQVVEKGLRENVGATPAATVNSQICQSIKYEASSSPFMRTDRGEYILRKYADGQQSQVSHSPSPSVEEPEPEVEQRLIHAFGMFWRRDRVLWKGNPTLLGKQQIGATDVDFSQQTGVYLLYDGRDVVYVGRATERPLGRRLYEHTLDRLQGRWDRFSWFGLLGVTEAGLLTESSSVPTQEVIAATLEALLIEGLEPTQNRRRGDGFTAVEYIQSEDPQIERQRMKQLLSSMQDRLDIG